MIVVASHAVFNNDGSPIHGTGSEISSYLQNHKKDYLFIKHPLYRGNNTFIEKFINGKLTIRNTGLKNVPFLFQRIQDYLITYFQLRMFRGQKNLFIGIDPFNAAVGVVVKKLGFVEKSVFYTADYAYKRFENPILNNIYHWFDRFSIKNSDYVWNVSTKIMNLRRSQGVSDDRNIFLPNTPEFRKVKRSPIEKINKRDIVIVSNLTSSINYSLIFDVVKRVVNKYKNTRLLIIGEGGYKNKLESLVEKKEIGKFVVFMGKKSHDEVLKVLSKSAIGIAFYTKTNTWTEFGDSMKVREYLACGLPVIMNDIVSTSIDVRDNGAGVIIRNDKRELYNAIDKLFSNKNVYKKTRQNAIKLANKYDFSVLFERALKLI